MTKWYILWLQRVNHKMAPKEGPRRPPRRKSPAKASELEYAGERSERRDRRSELEIEVEKLRSENRKFREAEARRRSQSSSTAAPAAPMAETRAAVRERPREHTVSLREFLTYNTPKFTGEDGEDP